MRPESADESKIIDLRQLSAMVDARGSSTTVPSTSQRAASVPAFGADQLGRVPTQLIAPALPTPVRLPPALSAPRRGVDTTVLLMMIGALTVAVVALALYVVASTPTAVVVESTPAVAPALEQDEAPKLERPVESAVVDPEPVEPVAEVAAPAIVAAADPLPPRARKRSPRKRANAPVQITKPREARPKEPAPPKPQARGTADLPAECVIDPKGCGLGATDARPAKPTSKTGPTDETLPTKLGQASIRKALAGVKADAKACGAKFGGKPGDKVMVKLSIAGATGRVTQAAPVRPHSGTPLGSCVAAALKRARFDRFGASVQGVQYGVRL